MGVAAGIGAVVGVYNAYEGHKRGKKAESLANETNRRQRYYNDLLVQLMEDPSKIFSDPGYQETFDQGLQAVGRSAAAKGFIGSGNAATELMRFGQGFSSQYLMEQKKLLASLSGAGGSTSPATYLNVAQNSSNSAFDQFGQVLAGLGYAFGGQAANSGNTMSSGSGGTLDPGQMDAGGGYIWNIPGTGTEG